MNLNRRNENFQHILGEETKAPKAPGTPLRAAKLSSDLQTDEVADLIIKQNQMINRALRRTYRSSVARKAL
jgi:hypothetical protein|tara:strand:- start:368 stop:580 length:213 start_codon:yes stop_codon:yes gene_type:complete